MGSEILPDTGTMMAMTTPTGAYSGTTRTGGSATIGKGSTMATATAPAMETGTVMAMEMAMGTLRGLSWPY
jgi:hypothetical protein